MTLRQVRKRAKRGQRQLAREAGVGKDVVNRLETRRLRPENARFGDLVRIVRGLRRAGIPDLDVEQLFPVPE